MHESRPKGVARSFADAEEYAIQRLALYRAEPIGLALSNLRYER